MRALLRLQLTVVTLATLMVAGCASPTAKSDSPSGKGDAQLKVGTNPKNTASGAVGTAKDKTSDAHSFTDIVQVVGAHIQMLDHGNGYAWGYHDDDFHLFHTHDNGVSWQPCSLPTLPTYAYDEEGPGNKNDVSVTFASDKTGWLTWVSNARLHVMRTTDGGTTWKENDVAIPAEITNIGQLQFVSPQQGWLLLLGDKSTGAAAKYLYETQNGGHSWKEVNSSILDLPHNGDSAIMRFSSDGKHGTLVSTNSFSQQPLTIETTNDAGAHWRNETVTLPATLVNQTLAYATIPPAPNKSQVANAVAVTDSTLGLLLFQRDAQGQWQPQTTSLQQVQACTWLSVQVGFALEHKDNHYLLYATNDAGQSWYQAGSVPNDLLADHMTVLQLDMTDTQTGWLLLQDSHLHPTLLETTDGGLHWTQL